MITRNRCITIWVALVAVSVLLMAFAAGAVAAPRALVVGSGQTEVIDETMVLNKLVLGDGATIVAPDGYELTLTVNGVETGGKLVTTPGRETAITGPAIYLGNIVLTVAEENLVPYVGMGPPGAPPPPPIYFPFRQALYLDEDGVDDARSVLAAVVGKKLDGSPIKNILIRSTGENFNGIFVAGGEQSFENIKIDLEGNGRSDFVGYGAAVTSRGTDTTVVLNKARIETDGVVRTAVVADTGSNMIVKNSYIQTNDGVLPSDYTPTIDTTQMRSVPWMLSLSGNCRATNLLGTETKASYINSYVGAEGWGVLSTDGCTVPQLTTINSTIAITGEDGYGSYAIGGAIERFLGTTFDVATYATICRGGTVYYGDSDPAVVAQLNTDLDLGLTAKELKSIPDRPTVVNSERFGVMWHGDGVVDVSGGTVFNTEETTFLDKGQWIAVTVDGSEGAKLNPGNGVIMQVMDDDDPGPQPPDMTNTGIYVEPTDPVALQPGHDLTEAAYGEDALATFADIDLTGDFFNGMRGDIPGPFGPPSPRNMGLTFEDSSLTGMISASTTHHLLSPIEYPVGIGGVINEGHEYDYKYLGEVTNTPSKAVNNGVIVSLVNSTWTVTGHCYLTSLTIDEDSQILAPAGMDITMTVDGVPTPIGSGSWTGAIELVIS